MGETAALPAVGEILEGRLEIVRLIARGGMGAVYEGRNLRTGRRVAIKVLLAEYASNAQALGRFQKEALACGRIRHPNVVDIYDASIDRGRPYLVMEMLGGESLGERIDREGRLPVEDAVEIVAQALEGLGAAHDAGIVHRDFKPENVVLTTGVGGKLQAKVVDFGISKLSEQEVTVHTIPGTVLGTPWYMAPEQTWGRADVDSRADLYAAATVLHHALGGRPPFAAPNLQALMAQIMFEPAPPLRSVRSEVTDELDAVVARALAKDPAERFATAQELAAALRGAVKPKGEPRAATTAAASPPASTLTTTTTSTSPSAVTTRFKRKGPGVPAAIALAAAGAAVVLFEVWPNGGLGLYGPTAAAIGLVLILSGVLFGAETFRWLPAVILCASQAVLAWVAAQGQLPEGALAPSVLGGGRAWDQLLGHALLQGFWITSFFFGAAVHRRYRGLAREVADADRGEAIREALLDEARGAYRRALWLGTWAIDRRQTAPATAVADSADAATRVAASPFGAGRDGADDAGKEPGGAGALPRDVPGAEAWWQAYRDRMKRQYVVTAVSCAILAVIFTTLAARFEAIVLVWVGCVIGVVWLAVHRALSRARPDQVPIWPWAVMALAAAVVGVGCGLNNGSVFAFIAALLLFGGVFRAPQRRRGIDAHVVVWITVGLATGIAFALTYTGVIPEIGYLPLVAEGVPRGQAIVLHLLLQSVLAGAYGAGAVLDRRQEAMMVAADTSSRRAARQTALLAAGNGAIERLLQPESVGMFAGQQIGPYRLGRLLGRGAITELYAAADVGTGEEAAVKLLRREHVADPQAIGAFVKESAALARLRSPYLAGVIAAGGVDEVPYLATELVEGETLAAMLRADKPLQLGAVRVLVRDVCKGLYEMHQAGAVHRDVRPQNLAWTTAGGRARWMILDVGAAQLLDLAPIRVSQSLEPSQYAAPEQARGEPVDARTDIYGLCAVARRALRGETQVPPDVQRVLRIGLAGPPGDRYASALELMSAFERACSSLLSEQDRVRADGIRDTPRAG